MEISSELEKLIMDIINLIRMDERYKQDMREDPDVFLTSLLLQFKREMSDPKSHSLHRHYAFDAVTFRSLVRAQEFLGKDKTPRGMERKRMADEISRPYELSVVAERTSKYVSKRRRRA